MAPHDARSLRVAAENAHHFVAESRRVPDPPSPPRLALRVSDSGKGIGAKAKKGAGIGLANVRQRLQLIYGADNADLVVRRAEGGEFRVELTLPLEIA